MEDLFKSMQAAVIEGESNDVVSLVEKALALNAPPNDILNNGLVAGMDVVAVRFKAGDMFIPEVLSSAKAMQAGNDLLKPLLVQTENTNKKGKIVIGTVKGDLHDIGKKIVAMMLEGAGFDVIDIGIDIPAEQFVKALTETGADIIGMSALLTTTMPEMGKVIEAAKKEGLEDKVKFMVGGAPVNDDFAKQIQAHYACDAGSAVELAKELTV